MFVVIPIPDFKLAGGEEIEIHSDSNRPSDGTFSIHKIMVQNALLVGLRISGRAIQMRKDPSLVTPNCDVQIPIFIEDSMIAEGQIVQLFIENPCTYDHLCNAAVCLTPASSHEILDKIRRSVNAIVGAEPKECP